MNVRGHALRVQTRVMRIPRQSAVALLRAYKWALSPLFLPACRYRPTCSEYAMEAVERFGVLRGGAMAAWRLLRCNPFVKGGYDPVLKTDSNCGPGAAVRLCKH